jgi:hypothetical protein
VRFLKKIVWIVCFTFAFSLLISGCNNANKSATQQDNIEAIITVDKNYLLALNTVNNFLIAWLHRDSEKGTLLLTEKVKSSFPEVDVRMFFSGLSNPHHQGFEVIGNEYVGENTIRFHVWLYEDYTGETPLPAERPEPYSIDVIKVKDDIWSVNNLPN